MRVLTRLNKVQERLHPDTEVWMQTKGPHIGLYCCDGKKRKPKWLMWLSKSHAAELELAGVKFKY